MARSDTTQDSKLAGVAVGGSVPHTSSLRRMRARLGRCAAGMSTATLGVSVATMAAAQSGGGFKTAPKSPEAEAAAEAAAASEGIDMILGIPVNTLFFVAAGLIGLFWFTLGGGRKPKISRSG